MDQAVGCGVPADEATTAASLQGNWHVEHLFGLEQALTRHNMLQGQIEA